ncbi:MAG: bifunctional UDP-N-acetylglucosamine diphosphorylase/glucosamine-1-phosphate N-acetyltransferase GlmU [Gammaproteobacteria bacterium]|nr:bifunctional UDP-N-acetylglucosamine diphosphorylase/glucosamine-1-phosphate N-acetyltransferase GlmU [Gammaproteobacteria bacterium]NND58795.1 bifunctional UDP-N-acetylglucosamine diphosphorylase/glucosamine-1-phosphate N-acetyltransferase GlmU [Gammaproteobacteria bacterium]
MTTVILAAGQGTRMRSKLPKVLQPLAGQPLLAHVVATAVDVTGEAPIVVYGHGGEAVQAAFADAPVEWAEQAEQLGTGHAVAQALPRIADNDIVVVLYGDVPLITATTLNELIAAAGDDRLGVLTAQVDDPTGYGRIVRDAADRVMRIVEQKDANPAELEVNEINTGFIACRASLLRGWVNRLSSDNAQGEYYLTDVIEMAVADGVEVRTAQPYAIEEILGINDKRQLAAVESALRARRAEALLDAGVTLADPNRVDIRGTVVCGSDVFIDVNVVFEGEVKLDDNVRIGPNCVIRQTQIEQDCEILPNTVIDHAHIGPRCTIGPFARVRPETFLGSEVRIGNFVEVKKSAISKGSKVNHLSYVGDSRIGENVNVGAGTITCNYDGANKHRTVIGDGAFIGSGTQLVAPVRIGEGSTIGAGSTISKDTPANALTLARARQRSIEGWQRPQKQPKDGKK